MEVCQPFARAASLHAPWTSSCTGRRPTRRPRRACAWRARPRARQRAGTQSKTISAAVGGPQLAMRAFRRTPNVFVGRTTTRRAPASPRAAQVTATARFAGPCASASAGTSSSVTWRLTASVSRVASRPSALAEDGADRKRAVEDQERVAGRPGRHRTGPGASSPCRSCRTPARRVLLEAGSRAAMTAERDARRVAAAWYQERPRASPRRGLVVPPFIRNPFRVP